jgi:hypothetical protein
MAGSPGAAYGGYGRRLGAEDTALVLSGCTAKTIGSIRTHLHDIEQRSSGVDIEVGIRGAPGPARYAADEAGPWRMA